MEVKILVNLKHFLMVLLFFAFLIPLEAAIAADEIIFVGDKEFRTLGTALQPGQLVYTEVSAGVAKAEAAFQPHMKAGELTGGADLRILYDTPGGLQQPVDTSKVLITLGFANYQGKDSRGRYGSLVSATLGRGMLMKGYTTNQRKMYYFGTEKPDAAFHLFSTDTHLTAARGVVKVGPAARLGVTYVGGFRTGLAELASLGLGG